MGTRIPTLFPNFCTLKPYSRLSGFGVSILGEEPLPIPPTEISWY